MKYGYGDCRICDKPAGRYSQICGDCVLEHQANTRKAHAKVSYAVREGKLIKPTLCEDCHEPKRLDGHHTDYNFPLEVVWLCRKCHKQAHATTEVIYAR